MREIYQVTIRGRKLESLDLRQLLARAVREKKNLDERLRIASSTRLSTSRDWSCADRAAAAFALSTPRQEPVRESGGAPRALGLRA